MNRLTTSLAAATTALTCLIAGPLTAGAAGTSTCPKVTAHALPKASGGTAQLVIGFGVQGGSMRPWTVKIKLDGTVVADGPSTSMTRVNDPAHTLRGLLALADAEGYWSMKKAVGCLGTGTSPDASSRYISIHTSSGTKRVAGFGSCAATARYDALFAVLQASVGFGS